MTVDVLFRPDTRTAEPVVVVFGRDEAGKPHASWFDGEAAPLALKAAGLMNMRVLSVETAEQRQLAERLARGRVFASGRAFTPFARENVYAELVKLADAASQVPSVETAPVTPSALALPAMPSQAPEQAAGQPASPATDDEQLAPATAAVAPAEPTRSDVVKPSSWEEIGVGSLVLATAGPDDGWWESVVVSLKDELLTLKWRDFPKERLFARRRTELALLPPSR